MPGGAWHRRRMFTTFIRAALVSSLVALSAETQTPAQPAAQPAAPTLADARARLQANDNAGAAALLEQITAATPGNAAAWQMLATTRRALKNGPGAIAAYENAIALAPRSNQLFFGMAAAHAVNGDADAAFTWLTKARDARLDMTRIETDPDLAPLRRDPRFARLRPMEAAFANPFVEDVTVLREWRGQSPNDQFGWNARNIGDVDGDGAADIVTSAPTKVLGGQPAGRIYVYSSGTGALLWSVDGAPGDRLGVGAEGAGDTNADGVPDVVAGAPGAGYASVYSGRDGAVLLTVRGEAATDAFGRQTSGVGDVNGDTHADFIVGAPNNGAGGQNAGRAYVYSGKDGALLLTLTGERARDRFGSSVGGAADGASFKLLVGAPGAGPNSTGRTYVYNGLSTAPQFVIEAGATGGGAMGAMFVAVPGDVNGDGAIDVYASDFMDGAKGAGAGSVYVRSGVDGTPLLTLSGEGPGENFGSSISVAGDVDGDGHADLIVGAWQYAAAAASGGRAYLYSGKTGTRLATYTCRTPGDTFGFDATSVGDVDGDGTIDLLITSAWSGVSGFNSGRIFVISSGVTKAGG